MSHVLCLKHISYLYFYCIHVFCYLLLISILLSTHAFLSCVHSMFHLVIQVCLSYIHIIYDFHGYILYHLLCSISMYCYHVPLSYTVIMYCFHILLLCTIFIYHVRSYNLMLQNLSSHSSAMLFISYRIFSHVIELIIT